MNMKSFCTGSDLKLNENVFILTATFHVISLSQLKKLQLNSLAMINDELNKLLFNLK